ncbi:hypothetical protein D9611_009076 [Ephemerocybe angulata]|uniref:F-box domain-containing protein n=1 Tax=Ephemerocybe angulata TaxID=980116 RepID=A0A8H5FJR7_9AGAR|nr:hypothetical protein D9611_009076 [Tulosesus angulatus]
MTGITATMGFLQHQDARGNEPPSPSEIDIIRSSIDVSRAQFSALAGMPYNRNLKKHAVPRKARKHLSTLHEYHRILSLVHLIPEEVLEYIFFLSTNVGHSPKHSEAVRNTLTSVSRRWRSVCISSPRFWCNLGKIEVSVSLTPQREARLLNWLRLALNRSGSAQSITFSFDAGMPYLDRLVPPATRILSLLSQFSRQWEDVELTVHAGVNRALDGIDGNLPHLRRLSLIHQGTDVPHRLDHFSDAPLLRSATIVFPGLFTQLHEFLKLPFNQLEEYSEDVGSEEIGFLPVLLTSPILHSLQCRLKSLPYPSPLQHESLRKLHIEFSTDNSTALRLLNLPSLTDLSITSTETQHAFPSILALILVRDTPRP